MSDTIPAAGAVPPPKKKGVIHDLGYARYAGERRSHGNWRVIARHQISYAWKTWWRWKLFLLGPLMTTVTVGAIMYVSRNKMFDALRANGAAVRLIDGLIPISYTFFRWSAFLLTLTLASTSIARDQESGAFAFYFSRPVRPRDYVLGKLVGMVVVMASALLVGPVVLAIFRVAVSENMDERLRVLPWLGYTVLIGVLSAVVYAASPMAMSALVGRRWVALGSWAGYWILGLGMIAGVASLSWKPLLVIDPGVAIDNLAFRLWGLEAKEGAVGTSATGCLISLCTHAAVMVSVLYWRVSRQVASSVGASS